MRRRKSDEPRLCPDCPRIGFLHLVMPRSYTRTPARPLSSVQICAKLRALKLSDALECQHFKKFKRIDLFAKPRRRLRK